MAEAHLADLSFRVIDTAGLAEAAPGSLEERMREQTAKAVAEADVALFLIDARAGVTALDHHFAQWLRRAGKPVLVVANKCEGGGGQPGLLEAFALGLGEPIPVSAEHGEGMVGLYEALRRFAPEEALAPEEEEAEAVAAEAAEAAEAERPIRLAVVGRPNVGKSTLVNRLLDEERLLTGPEPGITRNAVSVEWSWEGRPVVLVDTAGIRRRARVTEVPLEKVTAVLEDKFHHVEVESVPELSFHLLVAWGKKRSAET